MSDPNDARAGGAPFRADELSCFHLGQHAIFQSCVSSETPALLRYALKLENDHEHARELVQETWVRAFERRLTFDNRGPLGPWLCAICRNIHLTKLRRGACELHYVEQHATVVADDDDNAEDRSHIADRIRHALEALTERQRSVVAFRLLEGLSTRTTAVRLGVAEGTVKATLHQALARLRPLLEER